MLEIHGLARPLPFLWSKLYRIGLKDYARRREHPPLSVLVNATIRYRMPDIVRNITAGNVLFKHLANLS